MNMTEDIKTRKKDIGEIKRMIEDEDYSYFFFACKMDGDLPKQVGENEDGTTIYEEPEVFMDSDNNFLMSMLSTVLQVVLEEEEDEQAVLRVSTLMGSLMSNPSIQKKFDAMDRKMQAARYGETDLGAMYR